jgi:hypothetical protein
LLAQGQYNILAILQHKWKRYQELLNYKFLMFPRGEEQPEITAAIASGQILNIGGDFNDDTSSSEVRKRIRESGDYTSLLHPMVAAALAEMEPMPLVETSREDRTPRASQWRWEAAEFKSWRAVIAITAPQLLIVEFSIFGKTPP